MTQEDVKKGLEYAARVTGNGVFAGAYKIITEQEKEIERLRQEVRDTDKMARNTIEQYRAKNEELENALKQSEDNYSRAFVRLKTQQQEIERLRTTLGQCNTELNSALESLKSQCREIGKLKAGTKQAKIDVLNELKVRHDYVNIAMGYPWWNISQQIDELIKEVENE